MMTTNLDSLTDTVEFSESDSTIDDERTIKRNSDLCDCKSSFLIKMIHLNGLNPTRKVTEIYICDIKLICQIKTVTNISVKNLLNLFKSNLNVKENETQKVSLKEKTLAKLNPFVYEIELNHGKFSWTINRRYNEFLSVHEQLFIRLAALRLPKITKRGIATKASFREESKLQSVKIGRKKHTLPLFPRKLEILIHDKEIDDRKEALELYLQSICNYKSLRASPEILKFLEVSSVSFISSLGIKRKEGFVRKRCGGRTVSTGCLDFINCITFRWRHRWLFVKDTFVAYFNPRHFRMGDVLLVDNEFSVKYGKCQTGENYGLLIQNKSRKLLCACQTINQMMEWGSAIEKIMTTTAVDFLKPNKHDSFAPIRQETYCKWYIDGESYMNAVGNAMEIAKEEIFIANWWLSPQIHLKRPANDDYWRIDQVLLRKANQGVFIFVLLFKEIEMTLNINSSYTKKILASLHPNIQILRHPDHLKRGVFLWSHHEKIVVIDQKIALLGGIDLCYGRWDTHQHPIQDVASSNRKDKSLIMDSTLDKLLPKTCLKENYYPQSIVLQNADCVFKAKMMNRKWSFCSDDKRTWTKSLTQIFSNLNNCNSHQLSNRKFNDYYNAICICDKNKFRKSLLFHCSGWTTETCSNMKMFSSNHKLRNRFEQMKSVSNKRFQTKINVMNNQNVGLNDGKITPKSLFQGKDYVNWIVKDCRNLDKPDVDLIDRESIPRMPWHDIGCIVYGRCARDLARHFIQRWNAVKKEKSSKKKKYSMLVPKSYAHSEIQKIAIINCALTTCQLLRSVSKWSVNISSTESSILNAYIETIRKANHYIYIENQFFISSTCQESDIIKNPISKEILERIVYFHNQSKLFRVFIILPLLPAFETESEGFKSASLYTVLHYVYRSLFRGPNSLFESLKKHKIDPFKYVFIGSLRNFGFIGDKLFTEQIYIHSKLLIVDDKYTIIGSANLNDRSMLGYRDSEVAFYFEDECLEKSKFDNSTVDVGVFSSKLRKALMSEHLGITNSSEKRTSFFDIQLLNDPVQDVFFNDIWTKTAIQNSELFEEIFGCIPTNEAPTLSHFTKVRSNSSLIFSDPPKAEEKVHQIRGHLVIYPTKFLCDENLEPSFASRERIIPVETWL